MTAFICGAITGAAVAVVALYIWAYRAMNPRL